MNAPICADVVTITLQAIKDANPCPEGWEQVLKSRGPNPDFDAAFPLADIIESNCLEHAVWALRCVDKVHAQRFAIACAKMVLPLMKDQRSIDAVAMAERYVDGHATLDEMLAAADATADAAASAASAASAARAAYAAAYAASAARAARAAYAAAYAASAARAEIVEKQTAALRQILGCEAAQ